MLGLHAQPISIIGSKDKEDATASPGSPISPTDEDSTGKKNNKFIWNLKVSDDTFHNDLLNSCCVSI